METIDVTPTWVGILPLLLAGVEAGTPAAREELYRMARLAGGGDGSGCGVRFGGGAGTVHRRRA